MITFCVLLSVSAKAEGTNSLNVAFRYGGYETTKKLPVYKIRQDSSEVINTYYQRSYDIGCSFPLLEKAFFEKNFTSFTNEMQRLKVMNVEISADREHGHLIVAGTFARFIAAVVRMIESELPQLEWIDDSFFNSVFPIELMEREKNERTMKSKFFNSVFPMKLLKRDKNERLMKFKTYLVMLELGSKVVQYRRMHGYLPETLNDIPSLSERRFHDAWRKPIVYMQSDGKWLLKSLGENQKDDGYDFDFNLPLVPYGRDLVIYEGMSANRRKLLDDGVLDMGLMRIKLDGQTGAITWSNY